MPATISSSSSIAGPQGRGHRPSCAVIFRPVFSMDVLAYHASSSTLQGPLAAAALMARSGAPSSRHSPSCEAARANVRSTARHASSPSRAIPARRVRGSRCHRSRRTPGQASPRREGGRAYRAFGATRIRCASRPVVSASTVTTSTTTKRRRVIEADLGWAYHKRRRAEGGLSRCWLSCRQQLAAGAPRKSERHSSCPTGRAPAR